MNVLDHDEDTISFCRTNNITVEAYSPIGRNSSWIRNNEEIKSIAATHNVSTYQVAMKWILQHGHLLTFQSSSKEHQEADADLFKFSLSDKEMLALDKLQS